MLHKSGLTVKLINSTLDDTFTHFEHMDCSIGAHEEIGTILCVIYRPPPATSNGLKNPVFLEEWSEYLDRLATVTHELIIAGDFNFHLDNTTDGDAQRFSSLLSAHGLTQHVTGPAHIKGHTLDLHGDHM